MFLVKPAIRKITVRRHQKRKLVAIIIGKICFLYRFCNIILFGIYLATHRENLIENTVILQLMETGKAQNFVKIYNFSYFFKISTCADITVYQYGKRFKWHPCISSPPPPPPVLAHSCVKPSEMLTSLYELRAYDRRSTVY